MCSTDVPQAVRRYILRFGVASRASRLGLLEKRQTFPPSRRRMRSQNGACGPEMGRVSAVPVPSDSQLPSGLTRGCERRGVDTAAAISEVVQERASKLRGPCPSQPGAIEATPRAARDGVGVQATGRVSTWPTSSLLLPEGPPLDTGRYLGWPRRGGGGALSAIDTAPNWSDGPVAHIGMLDLRPGLRGRDDP